MYQPQAYPLRLQNGSTEKTMSTLRKGAVILVAWKFSLIYTDQFIVQGYRTRSRRSLLQTKRIVEQCTSQHRTSRFFLKHEKHRKRREEKKENSFRVEEVGTTATYVPYAARVPLSYTRRRAHRAKPVKVQPESRRFQLRPANSLQWLSPVKAIWEMPRTSSDIGCVYLVVHFTSHCILFMCHHESNIYTSYLFYFQDKLTDSSCLPNSNLNTVINHIYSDTGAVKKGGSYN